MAEKSTVLIVDDTPENLTLLNEFLKNEYKVKAVNNGKRALLTAAAEPQPDLILLDIRMPDMDGYVVCQKLKENEATRNIPVIFISALSETFEIVKAFQTGGVDYITKPFRPAEVQARVKTHIDLQHARRDLQALLSNTLTGSVRMMIDLLSLTQPLLMAQSARIRRYAHKLVQMLEINPQEAWNIELATMLAAVGCLGISPDILLRRNAKKRLSFEEMRRLEEYPAMGAEMIGRIPRLEKVAEMVRNQNVPIHQMIRNDKDVTYMGSAMLHMLLAFDTLVASGKETDTVLNLLEAEPYPSKLLEGLRMMVSADRNLEPVRVTFGMLQQGMVLAEDLEGNDGGIVLGNGSELSGSLIQLLQHFAAQGNSRSKKVLVWDPTSAEHHMPAQKK